MCFCSLKQISTKLEIRGDFVIYRSAEPSLSFGGEVSARRLLHADSDHAVADGGTMVVDQNNASVIRSSGLVAVPHSAVQL
jgi:hypothetical protein